MPDIYVRLSKTVSWIILLLRILLLFRVLFYYFAITQIHGTVEKKSSLLLKTRYLLKHTADTESQDIPPPKMKGVCHTLNYRYSNNGNHSANNASLSIVASMSEHSTYNMGSIPSLGK